MPAEDSRAKRGNNAQLRGASGHGARTNERQIGMLFAVITSGGDLDEASVRAAARAAGVSDHIRVEMVVNLRWFEPIEADVSYYADPYVPEPATTATDAFLADLDERLEAYARICAEGSATYSARRAVGIPKRILARAARESDVLVLPHPAVASADIRQAVWEAIGSPPCPLLVVGTSGRIRTATVRAARSDLPLEGSARDVLRRLLRGRVERISIPASFRTEDFAGWAPVITADRPPTDPRRPGEPGRESESDFLAIVGAPRARTGLALGRGRRWQPPTDGNTLLLPA